jgi:hypothetical protein
MSSVDEQLFVLHTVHMSENVVPCNYCQNQALWVCYHDGRIHYLCEKHAREFASRNKVKVFKVIHPSATREV